MNATILKIDMAVISLKCRLLNKLKKHKLSAEQCDASLAKTDRVLTQQERLLLIETLNTLEEPSMKQPWLDQIKELRVVMESYCVKHNHFEVYFQHYREECVALLVSAPFTGDRDVNVFVDEETNELSLLEISGAY
jgi:hypothetical protein